MNKFGVFVLFCVVIAIGVGAYAVLSKTFLDIKLPSFFPTSPFHLSLDSLFGPKYRKSEVVRVIGKGTPSQRSSRSSTVSPTVPTSTKPAVTPPSGFTVAQLSPYYNSIHISRITPTRLNREKGRFSIFARTTPLQGINITGWKLRGNRGGETFLPQAIQDYEPSGLAQEKDIFLHTGDTLNVYVGNTPLGRNLRLNMCTGYLNNYFTVTPSFPNTCPRVNRGEVVTFPGDCQNFILSLGSCKVPTSNQINQFTGQYDAACRARLDTLNYYGCYTRYHDQINFFSKEIRAWISQILPFDEDHDRVLLFDREGLLVHEYIY